MSTISQDPAQGSCPRSWPECDCDSCFQEYVAPRSLIRAARVTLAGLGLAGAALLILL